MRKRRRAGRWPAPAGVRRTEPGIYVALHICALSARASRPGRDDDRVKCRVHQTGGAPPNRLSSAVME